MKKKKTQQKRLSKRQLLVIEDLLSGELDEAGLLAKHRLSARILGKWYSSELFKEEIAARLEQLRRQGELIIARYAPVAAMRLVELAAGSREETARKACLDIMSLPRKTTVKSEPAAKPAAGSGPAIRPETASRLLEALAKEKD